MDVRDFSSGAASQVTMRKVPQIKGAMIPDFKTKISALKIRRRSVQVTGPRPIRAFSVYPKEVLAVEPTDEVNSLTSTEAKLGGTLEDNRFSERCIKFREAPEINTGRVVKVKSGETQSFNFVDDSECSRKTHLAKLRRQPEVLSKEPKDFVVLDEAKSGEEGNVKTTDASSGEAVSASEVDRSELDKLLCLLGVDNLPRSSEVSSDESPRRRSRRYHFEKSKETIYFDLREVVKVKSEKVGKTEIAGVTSCESGDVFDLSRNSRKEKSDFSATISSSGSKKSTVSSPGESATELSESFNDNLVAVGAFLDAAYANTQTDRVGKEGNSIEDLDELLMAHKMCVRLSAKVAERCLVDRVAGERY